MRRVRSAVEWRLQKIALGGGQSMRQGIFRQLRRGAEIEMENNLCFMKLDGFGRDVQERRDFFNSASFRNEL